MNYRKISAKIILLLLILLPFLQAFPANAALLKVTLKSDFIQINGGGTANLSLNAKYTNNNNVGGAVVTFTATPLACIAPANTSTNPQGDATAIFTGPATPPTVVCKITATATSGTDTGSATATIVVGSDYAPLVPLPGIGTPTSFPAYLVGLYELALMSIGIFAMLMILYGGFKYMTSAGNPALMGDAKDAIWSAIFGLILALLSWLILGTVNPELTMIKTPGTTFSPFTAPATTASEICSTEGTLTSPTCHCIDGTTITKNPGYESATCNQACSDSLPIVSITGGGGSGARAKVSVVSGAIQNPLTIITGGSGYTTAPTVTITDDSGSGVVVGAVTLTAGAITNIAITSGGIGYGPTIPSDNKHHCLKAVLTLTKASPPGIGQILNGLLYNTPDTPLVTYEYDAYKFDLKTNSIIYNSPYSMGCIDGLGIAHVINNVCDNVPGNDETLPGGWLGANLSYTWFSASSRCTITNNPEGILCPFSYWVTDNLGNIDTDVIWLKLLKPI